MGEQGDYKVSGSIGVALYPEHGKSYEALYQSADKALYQSKALGKDRYTIYRDELAEGTRQKLTNVDNRNRPMQNYYDAELVSAIFDILFEGTEVPRAMHTVLRILARHLNVERCYVARTVDDAQTFQISYEWAEHTEIAQKMQFQNIPAEELSGLFAELEHSDVIHQDSLRHKTASLTEPLGQNSTFSYLMAQTKSKGYARLILGLDDKRKHRVWSEKEVNTVQYIVKMIALFIGNHKTNKEGSEKK